jgi:hypothetical protein
MGRYLVVANRTLGGRHLVSAVQRRAAHDPDCHVHVVVPHHEGVGGADPGEDDLDAVRARIDDAVAAFRSVGAAEVTSELVGETPVDAVRQVLDRDGPAAEVLLSTLPVGASRWWRGDVPHRLAAAVAVPVTHLVADDGRPHPRLIG